MGKLLVVDTFNRVNYFSQLPEVGALIIDEAREIDELIAKVKTLIKEISEKQTELATSIEEDWTKEEILKSLGNKFFNKVKKV